RLRRPRRLVLRAARSVGVPDLRLACARHQAAGATAVVPAQAVVRVQPLLGHAPRRGAPPRDAPAFGRCRADLEILGLSREETMSYSLMTLWNERQRFLPAVMAVAFSALLLAMQSGLLWGSLAVVSLPVDHAAADVWVGSA